MKKVLTLLSLSAVCAVANAFPLTVTVQNNSSIGAIHSPVPSIGTTLAQATNPNVGPFPDGILLPGNSEKVIYQVANGFSGTASGANSIDIFAGVVNDPGCSITLPANVSANGADTNYIISNTPSVTSTASSYACYAYEIDQNNVKVIIVDKQSQ